MKYNFYGWQTADIRDSLGLTPRDYYDLLSEIWCADTCAPRMRSQWSRQNRTLGQCSITAFLMQDIYGGTVHGVPLKDGNFHCFNQVGSCIFDLTSEQFPEELDYENCPRQDRAVHFSKEEKKQRYELLRFLLKKRITGGNAAASAHGETAAAGTDFTRLTACVDSLHAAGVPGCDLAVYKDHELIYRHMAGFRDSSGREAIRGDETYWLYSCTKVFTSCAAMQLIERGLLHLDDPVSMYLPAYASLKVKDGEKLRSCRRVMTIRHLMSMQSGLDYNLEAAPVRRVLEETKGKASTLQVAQALAQEPLSFEPGSDFLYSLSHDVLAAVIETVSGMRFSDYLSENIFEPLGMKTAGFKPDRDKINRMCAQYCFNDTSGKLDLVPASENQYRLSENYESGGAGLIADVKDCITLADTLACGGRSQTGKQILSPEMIQLWNTNQLGKKARASFDEWKRLGYSYGLGVRVRVDTSIGGRGQIGEFGWDGAAGAWMMIDPVNHISAFYAMHVRNFGYSYYVIHPAIRSLIYEAVLRQA